MDINAIKKKGSDSIEQPGQFEGKFLLAMPSIGSDFFYRSIIYLCAHSSDGAMGFQINKRSSITFGELIRRSELGKSKNIDLEQTRDAGSKVLDGGPVDEHRGFVLHSQDYECDATIPICSDIYLTSNVQILRALMNGHGPARFAVSLGYAGWGAGQLEKEIAENAWLTVDAETDMIFGVSDDEKYEQLLAHLGINPANLVADCGHA